MQIPCNRPIPHAPGVYLFKDEKGTNIYIGKAKDLKKRVSSYFRKRQENDKTAALVKKISSVDFIFTDNEEEAILLEGNLIKQHYPKYNIMLKDNAPLTYALITDEEFPRLLRVRKDRYGKIRGPKGKAYGPFMSGSARGMALGLLRKAFGIRTCNSPIPKRICLQFHLGNCPGPCEGKISREEYSLHVQKVRNLLSDQKKIGIYLDELEQEMRKESAAQNFEKAIILRNALHALGGLGTKQKMDEIEDKDEDYIVIFESDANAKVQVWKMIHGVIRDRQKFDFEFVGQDAIGQFLLRYYEARIPPKNIYVNKMPSEPDALENHFSRLRNGSAHVNKMPAHGHRAELMQLIEKNIMLEKAGGADVALVQLQKELSLLKLPLVIECFDISNLGENDVVGSMVQFVNAKPKKENYRKFKIRSVVGQDDFASIKEVVFRRYRRLLDEGETMPDIILIDGGLGQLHAAKNALEQLNLQIPLFSIAKKEELVYGIDLIVPIKMKKNNEALHLLQRCRDEAHRFAISYNRKLRKNIG